jgi:hypothetical protein
VENSIELSLKALMTVFENNDFDKVILLAKPYVDHSLYHSSLVSKISMLKAGLTLDKVIVFFKHFPGFTKLFNFTINIRKSIFV